LFLIQECLKKKNTLLSAWQWWKATKSKKRQQRTICCNFCRVSAKSASNSDKLDCFAANESCFITGKFSLF
jgi:hypothetical protein